MRIQLEINCYKFIREKLFTTLPMSFCCSGVFSIELFARILLHCNMFDMISNSVMHLHNEFTVSRLPYCCNKENICVANNRHHCPRSFIQISVQLTGMHWPFWPVLTNENFKSICLICRIKLIFSQSI